MNKKTYNKPEIRERKRVIVTTMICVSPSEEITTLQIRRRQRNNTDSEGQKDLINPWEAD